MTRAAVQADLGGRTTKVLVFVRRRLALRSLPFLIPAGLVIGLFIAFGHVGLDYNDFVKVDQQFFRPAEVDLLVGDAGKARATLGWEPEVSFASLVEMMVDADVELVAWQKFDDDRRR